MHKQFLLCIHNTGYTVALELRKLYEVLPDVQADADGYVRVVDESGEDYLYPASWFARVELPIETRDALLAMPV